jgi:hypothetical protein
MQDATMRVAQDRDFLRLGRELGQLVLRCE